MPFNLKVFITAILSLSLLLLSGCAVTPKILTIQERRDLINEDHKALQKDVKPVGAHLGFHEAIARALKYNLDYRSKMMEQAIALGTEELSNYDMLPKVVANAGYNSRDNYFVTKAKDSVTGEPSLSNPYVNSDKSYGTANLNLSWNVLDFGVSYFNAKQNADRILVASERRRRTMHVLVQDVQAAYIRAAAAQKLKTDLVRTIHDANEALDNSKKTEKEGVKSPLDALRYQKSLLDNIKILETIDQELSSAFVELNQLTNTPPGSTYALDDPDKISVPKSHANRSIEEFEVRALISNADMNEGIYNARIALQETHKSMLKLFPNLNFMISPQTSDNSYWINKNWVESSAAVSFNLWNVLMAPTTKRLADQNESLAKQKRAMVQMAVVSQVYLAKMQLLSMEEIYKRSADIDNVDTEIAQIITSKEKEGAASKAERVAADASMILSKLRKYQALSQFFGASGKMQATVGLEPAIGSVPSIELDELTHLVETSFKDWNEGHFPDLKETKEIKASENNSKDKPSFFRRWFMKGD
jgi:outer membrane protein TolC